MLSKLVLPRVRPATVIIPKKKVYSRKLNTRASRYLFSSTPHAQVPPSPECPSFNSCIQTTSLLTELNTKVDLQTEELKGAREELNVTHETVFRMRQESLKQKFHIYADKYIRQVVRSKVGGEFSMDKIIPQEVFKLVSVWVGVSVSSVDELKTILDDLFDDRNSIAHANFAAFPKDLLAVLQDPDFPVADVNAEQLAVVVSLLKEDNRISETQIQPLGCFALCTYIH